MTEATEDLEKAKLQHVMYVAGNKVGDALVLMLQDKNFGNNNIAQDFASRSFGGEIKGPDVNRPG